MTGLRADREPEPALFVPAHDSVRRGEAVGASARQADRLNPVDHRGRIEKVGLACSWPAATNVARRHRSAVDADDCGAGTPTSAVPLIVADQDARHLRDVAEAHVF